ncbi:MAG: cytochrome c [Magnetococcales bacterium]|nr:cytochrome c [Magnetococcales bacterium]
MKKIILGVLLASACAAAPAFAAGDAAAGKAKAGVCFACHGPDGISKTDTNPNLAGQKAAYLVAQLKAFRDGKRVNPMMTAPTKPLTDADIDNLAAFFSGLGK